MGISPISIYYYLLTVIARNMFVLVPLIKLGQNFRVVGLTHHNIRVNPKASGHVITALETAELVYNSHLKPSTNTSF